MARILLEPIPPVRTFQGENVPEVKQRGLAAMPLCPVSPQVICGVALRRAARRAVPVRHGRHSNTASGVEPAVQKQGADGRTGSITTCFTEYREYAHVFPAHTETRHAKRGFPRGADAAPRRRSSAQHALLACAFPLDCGGRLPSARPDGSADGLPRRRQGKRGGCPHLSGTGHFADPRL